MVETTLEIRNPSGLHARPLATFVKAAAAFTSDVQVTNLTRDPGKTTSGKSMLGLLSLGVVRGHSIRISAEGADAEAAIASLGELVASGLGEPLPELES
jgi:phosphotransferase system HPr (HPr) family protein